MAAGAPAGAPAQKGAVRNFPDEDIAGRRVGPLNLCVALQAKIGVAFGQHFCVNRSVRVMANDAALAQRFMFEDECSRLFAVAIRASFVQARHGQAAGWLKNIASVRIMALHAIHQSFEHRMSFGQLEFCVRVQVTLETGRRVAPRIQNEPAPSAPHGDMFAAGAVARFAAGRPGKFGGIEVNTRVRAAREYPRVIRMTLSADFIPDESCAIDLGRSHDGAIERRA